MIGRVSTSAMSPQYIKVLRGNFLKGVDDYICSSRRQILGSDGMQAIVQVVFTKETKFRNRVLRGFPSCCGKLLQLHIYQVEPG